MLGFFVWTLCNRRMRFNARGNFLSSSVMPINGRACLLLPDGGRITEPCYTGHGKFGDKDVFELVVDWNKDYLVNIFAKGKGHEDPNSVLLVLAPAIQRGESEILIRNRIIKWYQAYGADSYESLSYLLDDWKRFVGICLVNGGFELPYPIKIVSTPNCRKKYEDLPASILLL